MAASSRAQYNRMLKIIEQWPIDKSRKGRDFGSILRKRFGETFPKGPSSSTVDPKRITTDIEALQSLSNNVYKSKWPRTHTSSALGFSATDLNDTLCDDGIDALQKERLSVHGVKLAFKDLFKRKKSSGDDVLEPKEGNKEKK